MQHEASTNAPVVPGPIHTAATQLFDNNEILRRSLCALEERLNCVLKPVTPAGGGACGDSVDAPCSDMTGFLIREAARIKSFEDRVNTIISRLEL